MIFNKKQFKLNIRLCALRFFQASGIGLVITLCGCAVPGYGALQGVPAPREQQKEHILGYRPVVETAPTVGAPDGAIFTINRSLIREKLLQKPVGVSTGVQSIIGRAPAYSIGPGDVVGIVVYDHPELLPNSGAVISQASDPTGVSVAPGFTVGANGQVSFPYVGRVTLEGLNEIEASDLIVKRLSAYIKDPQVTVRIQSFRSKRAYVEGEVRVPGMQIFTDIPMTLAEAISRSGGLTANGDRSNIVLTRANNSVLIDLVELENKGLDAAAVPLKNGDIINIKNRDEKKIYVMGEILRPSAVLMKNGRLSLNEALGEAGGPNLLTANTGQIYVVRNVNKEKSEIYNLDAKNPAALALADLFILEPRDIVYVDPVPLVIWNRIVSLILPAAQVVDLGSQAATR